MQTEGKYLDDSSHKSFFKLAVSYGRFTRNET